MANYSAQEIDYDPYRATSADAYMAAVAEHDDVLGVEYHDATCIVTVEHEDDRGLRSWLRSMGLHHGGVRIATPAPTATAFQFLP